MTDPSKYRIIARDKDGKELGSHELNGFGEALWRQLWTNFPGATLTIERLPPEEAEPRRVWVNEFGDGLGHHAFRLKETADEAAPKHRISCVQFIEAKITASSIKRLRAGLRYSNGATDDELWAALAAALEIEE